MQIALQRFPNENGSLSVLFLAAGTEGDEHTGYVAAYGDHSSDQRLSLIGITAKDFDLPADNSDLILIASHFPLCITEELLLRVQQISGQLNLTPHGWSSIIKHYQEHGDFREFLCD